MKRNTLLTGLLLVSGSLLAQDWPTVQTEARPAARWWWMGSAVDAPSLTYNIGEYAKAGLGTLEITPIYGVQGNEANELKYLSPEWTAMLKHTQAEAQKRGMQIDMNNGTGWPFGGPEVTLEDAATKAVFQEYKIEGGKEVKLNVEVQDKKQQKVAVLTKVMAYNKKLGKKLDITSKVKGSQLTWNAPAGEWQVIALYLGKTQQKVKRAAPGGEGYVMDHLNKEAVKRYLDKFDMAFKRDNVVYPTTFFNDSYEVYQADWTPSLLDEFARRRGYKLEDYFPEFLDEKRPEITARIVSDYRETISELLLENFTKQWTAWAHRHGSITRNQGHGSPANLIDIYASVDIPECEGFGLSQFHIKGLRQDSITRKNDSDISMLKYASSAAHITGKPYTSSETFTWLTEHFRTSLSQCKPDMDLMFVSGVNHMFFHGTPYSPKEAEWPGWLFYASINMSPTNTIWRDAPAFFQYITRCQSFLQMGKPDNDFLVYLPVYDMWEEQAGRLLLFDIHQMAKRAPKFINTIHQIMSNGYDVDYISDQFVRNTRYENGRLVTKGGSNYKAIIVPAVKYMPENVLAHLITLAKQGATIVFMENYPVDVQGFSKLESRRNAFRKVVKQLPVVSDFQVAGSAPLGKGKIITGTDYATTLDKCETTPEEMKTAFGLQYIRRQHPEGHHYFISSLQDKGIDGWVTLSVNGQSAMLFDPMTGEKGLAQTQVKDGKLQVYLQLKSGESIILQTFNRPVEAQAWNYTEEQPFSLSLDHNWKLRFIESTPAIEDTFDIDTPSSWTEINHPHAKINMGTGLYSLEIDLPSLKADDWILDLGDVRESARVRINGKDAGTAWAVPFRLNVGKYLQTGKNLIEIEVTNLPANRIAELDRQNVPWRKFKEINFVGLNYQKSKYGNWAPLPSGLNGGVRLIPVSKLNKE